MIEIRQTQDELPGNSLPDSSGHASGLLCRKHAQQFMRLAPKVHTKCWTSAEEMMRKGSNIPVDVEISRYGTQLDSRFPLICESGERYGYCSDGIWSLNSFRRDERRSQELWWTSQSVIGPKYREACGSYCPRFLRLRLGELSKCETQSRTKPPDSAR